MSSSRARTLDHRTGSQANLPIAPYKRTAYTNTTNTNTNTNTTYGSLFVKHAQVITAIMQTNSINPIIQLAIITVLIVLLLVLSTKVAESSSS